MIYLATLPAYYRTRKGVGLVVKYYNLRRADNVPGKGNRWRRRAGLHVHNPDHSKPFGLIAMDRGQIARMLRTPPDQSIK